MSKKHRHQHLISPLVVLKLPYRALVVGREQPDLFNTAMKEEKDGRIGWISAEGSVFPMDVILALEKGEALINRVEVIVEDHMLPRYINFKLGRSQASSAASHISRHSHSHRGYASARLAAYSDAGRLEFDPQRSQHPEDKRRQVLAQWFGGRSNAKAVAQYIWLVIGEPYASAANPQRRVHLRGIEIYGSVAPTVRELRSTRSSKHIRTKRKTNSAKYTPRLESLSPSFESALAHRSQRIPRPPDGVELTRLGFRRWRLSSHSSSSSSSSTDSAHETLSNDYQTGASPHHRYPIARTSDPQAALINMKTRLKQRRKKAAKRGREVEATLCQRSIELIHHRYEREIAEAMAKQHRDPPRVANYEARLKNIQDACYRSLHLDLLLEEKDDK